MYNENEILSKWNAEMYDRHSQDTRDIDFLLSVIGPPPKRVLEIACGSGRILVPLAKAGYTAVGMDFDEAMLDRIAPRAEGIPGLSWHRADVIADNWGTGFDVVLLAGNILFNIVSGADYAKAQRTLIEKAAGALVPGGGVYIDYGYFAHPEAVFRNPGERVIWEGSDSEGNTGRMSLVGSTYDPGSRITEFTRRFELTLRDGRTVRQDIPSRKHFASLEQLRGWLGSAGFSVKAEYGDFDRNPVGENTDRALIWAEKRH